MKIFNKIKNIILFKKFCKKNFLTKSKKDKTKIVLIEFNSIAESYIPYSYFISKLSEKFDAKIVAFTDLRKKSILKIIKLFLMKIYPLSTFSIYKSFGVIDIFYFISLNERLKKKINQKYKMLISKINDKREFENLKINKILVGDLFYDTYLKKYNKPTIDFKNEDFKQFLYDELSKFYCWYEFINQNLKSIVVSHTVYSLAVPLRICIQKKINAYQVNATHIYKLNDKKYMAYKEYESFPKLFSKLSSKKKLYGLKNAKKRLDLRFRGKIGVDMSYSKKSAYNKLSKKRLLKENNKTKILIATHCFYDSPHTYGNNLFPDFYEWLDFLGKMTNKTDYDWYIKTHPDYIPGTMEIIDKFVKRYPKFNLLPAESSHNQLLKEGIDTVFTVYGTIGCEYPLFNKLVINASMNNPHIAYKFNLHCKSVKDYEIAIKKLPKLIKKFSINKNKVYEYYYMQNLHDIKNIFYRNFIKKKINNLEYDYLGKWENLIVQNKNLEFEIQNKIENFIQSNKYFSRL